MHVDMCSITKCTVRGQTAGCPTSKPVDFLVPGLDGYHFVAWGVDRGVINVGCFQVPPGTSGDPTAPFAAPWRHLVSLQLENDGFEENAPAPSAVTHLAFGGGPHMLLAAATRTHLAVFSLELLMDHVFAADSEALTGGSMTCNFAWELSSAVHAGQYLVGAVECAASADVLGISWTHQLDGLLVADAAGGLVMWQLRLLTPLSSSFALPGTAAQLRRVWEARAPRPQDLISAGVSVDAPAASASSHAERGASVWWPETFLSPPGSPGAAPQARRERLKLPCEVKWLAWCPGVLRKDVLGAGLVSGMQTPPNGGPEAEKGSAAASSTPVEDHPALMTLGIDGVVRIWVEMLVVHNSAPFDSTAGAAGAVGSPQKRQLGASPFASRPGTPDGITPAASPRNHHQQQQPSVDSYFAMALVVDPQPPTTADHDPTPSPPPPAARPLSDSSPESTPPSAPAGAAAEQAAAEVTAVRWVKGTGAMLGRQRRGSMASPEVLWLVVVSRVGSGIPADDRSMHHVRLYAVRGLAAVVVANLPGSVAGVSSMAMGSKRPQAVLWGEHIWEGAATTTTQHSLATTSSAPCFSTFSAWMSAEADFPRVTCFDASCLGSGTAGEAGTVAAAAITYTTVLADSPNFPESLHQRLDALYAWGTATRAHAAPICAAAVTSSSGRGGISGFGDYMGKAVLAATVDVAGQLLLWRLQTKGCLEARAAIYLPRQQFFDVESRPIPCGQPRCLAWVAAAELGVPQPRSGGGTLVLLAGVGNCVVGLSSPIPTSGKVEDMQVDSFCALEGDVFAVVAIEQQRDTSFGSSVVNAQQAPQVNAVAIHCRGDSGPRFATLLEITCSAASSTGGAFFSSIAESPPAATAASLPQLHVRPIATAELPCGVASVTAAAALPGVPGGILVGTEAGTVFAFSLILDFSGARVAVAKLCRGAAALPSGCAVAALAVDSDGGMAAAVGGALGESRLALWKLPVWSSNAASRNGSPPPHPTDAALSAVSPPHRIRLQGAAAATVGWPKGLVVPCVAVGRTDGTISYFAPTRDATEGWRPVATAEVGPCAVGLSPAVHAVHADLGGGRGAMLAAAGARLLSLSDAVEVGGEMKTMSRHLMEACGPLPQYHPSLLRALLRAGCRDSAAAILTALAGWLPQYQQYQEHAKFYRLFRTNSEAGTAGADAATPRAAEVEATTPKVEGEDYPVAPPAFPAVALDKFIDRGLAGLGERLEDCEKESIDTTGNAFSREASSAVMATAASATTAKTQSFPGRAISSMDSGLIDFGAFGSMLSDSDSIFFNPPSIQPGMTSMESGMVDLAAFGMEMAPQPAEQSTTDLSSLDSGTLDLGAFGMDFMPPPPPPQPAQSQPLRAAPAGAASSSSIAGMRPAGGASGALLLEPPRQAQVPPAALRLLPTSQLLALQQAAGLAPTKSSSDDEDDASALFSHRNTSVLFLQQQRQRRPSEGLMAGLLCRRPTEPYPGLTLEETHEVVALASFFSEAAAFGATVPVDESGARFLSSVTLAAARPLELGEASFAALAAEEDSMGLGSRIDSAFRMQSSSMSLMGSMEREASSSGHMLGLSMSRGSSAGLARDDSAVSLAMKKSRSVRNAAGVEYTLPPSMASFASLGGNSNAEEEEREAGSPEEDSNLAKRWGLAAGLPLSALLWAQLSSCPEALLQHAAERIRVRDVEVEAAAAAWTASQGGGDNGGSIGGRNKPEGAFWGSGQRQGSSMSGEGVTWPMLRMMGAGFWLRDKELLSSTAEGLAKARFAARRNPDDAALLYIALGKKVILQGLYRMTQHARQADFLTRDFTQERHQQAACKNAFVLLGAHRHELAAAFFLLGGSTADALSVCIKELGDVQLALFIARLVQGPGGEAERSIVSRHILPAVAAASPAGKRWGGAMAEWLLGAKGKCLASLLQTPDSSNTVAGVDTVARDPPDSIIQLFYALDVLCKAKLGGGSGGSSAAAAAAAAVRCAVRSLDEDQLQQGLNSARDVLRALSVSVSEALQGAGLPVLALQAEAVAASSGAAADTVDPIRAAWAAAAALLPQPPGAQGPAGSGSAADRQLSALNVSGVDLDKFEAQRRLHRLQAAVELGDGGGLTHNNSSSGTSMTGLSSITSPSHQASPSSGLFRHSSLDNYSARTTYGSLVPPNSAYNRPASLDGHTPARWHRGGGHHHHHHHQHHHGTKGRAQRSPGGPLAPATLVFSVDSDSLLDVACCPLMAPAVGGRPIVAATSRHGLLEFAAQAPPPTDAPADEGSEGSDYEEERDAYDEGGDGQQGLLGTPQKDRNYFQGGHPSPKLAPSSSMFSRFLSQIFDQTSWLLDPLERAASEGDLGLAAASAMTGVAGGAGMVSPIPSSITPPSPRASADHSRAALLLPSETKSRALAAHPTRQLFLSGCETTGRIHLWQFGGPRPSTAFTPVASADLPATAESGMLSFSFGGGARGVPRSTSVVGRLGHWGGAAGLAFSSTGERFAAVGDGGVVAIWRLGGGVNRLTDVDGAVCAEWWNHCLSKQGRAVVYVGGGGSVVAVGGKCSLGNISLWDAASPPADACVGRLKQHAATVNALCTLPGGWLLAAADAAGALSLSDVRMLGGSAGGARTLWSVRASKGAVEAMAMLPPAVADRPRALALGAATGGVGSLVTGGADGMVRVWEASSGKLIQSLEGTQTQPAKGGSRLLALGGGLAAKGVTGLAVCEEGVVSCGKDGTVRLFPMTRKTGGGGY